MSARSNVSASENSLRTAERDNSWTPMMTLPWSVALRQVTARPGPTE